jgi:hypothetical protein
MIDNKRESGGGDGSRTIRRIDNTQLIDSRSCRPKRPHCPIHCTSIVRKSFRNVIETELRKHYLNPGRNGAQFFNWVQVPSLHQLAASEDRKTAAPANSSIFPKRFIGVRNRNSWPRGVPASNCSFREVRNTPSMMALTQIPCAAHSTARDCVKDRTADLLAP